MRKSRKDGAPKPPSSLFPTKQTAYGETEVKRPCLFCRQVPAVQLDYEHGPKSAAIFCCAICAATWALQHVQESNLTWCLKHQLWSLMNGHCVLCVKERLCEELHGKPGLVRVEKVEGEVKHV